MYFFFYVKKREIFLYLCKFFIKLEENYLKKKWKFNVMYMVYRIYFDIFIRGFVVVLLLVGGVIDCCVIDFLVFNLVSYIVRDKDKFRNLVSFLIFIGNEFYRFISCNLKYF